MRQEHFIQLLRGDATEATAATLVLGISEEEMGRADAEWQPFLQQAIEEARQAGAFLWDLPEHKHWDWEAKARNADPLDRFFGIIAEEQMQGMMIVKPGKLCRLTSQQGLSLVYIDYLATAPWNLRGLVPTPRFRSVGKALLVAAVMFSKEQGCQGRIGLHALPQAEGFYATGCGMTNLGVDTGYHDLRYFKMTPEQATRLAG